MENFHLCDESAARRRLVLDPKLEEPESAQVLGLTGAHAIPVELLPKRHAYN